ncbi:hypothetical protein PQX77_008672, partial [Marasmius sp. AFHP31]
HSRVDFQFYNTDNTHLDLNFTLRLPLEVRTRLRAAYLCQSEKRSNRETFFIDEVGFSITGNLSHNPTTSLAPTYLFIPPLDAEYIDGMYCVPDPPPYPLFYWSWDTEGKTMISEEDWEQAGVPELAIDMCIGSCWEDFEYDMVKRHLRKKKYAVDGKQYTRDHGYPELIWGDPHDRRIEEAEEMNSNDDWENLGKHGDSKNLDENKPCSSTSQHKSLSPLLLVDPPLDGMSAYFGDRDILHARNMESSVEETRCFEQQIARHANRSKDVAQKSNPNKLFSTFGFDPSNPSQGAIGVPVDSYHNAFTRLTPPQTAAKAVAMSSRRAQPKTAQVKFFRSKTAVVGMGEKATPARRCSACGFGLSKPSEGSKSLERGSRNDTSMQKKPPEAPGQATVVSSSRTRLKTAEQRSPGMRTARGVAGQEPTTAIRLRAAGRVVATPTKPKKQPEPEDRKVTRAKPSSGCARTMGSQSCTGKTVKKPWR